MNHAWGSTPSPERSRLGKSRTWLAVLLTVGAAFLLAPVAQASAEDHFTLTIIGTGSGEVTSNSEFFANYVGTPPIECSYAAPGPETGTCENTLASLSQPPIELAGKDGIPLKATPAAGSVFDHWTVTEGEEFFESCASEEPTCFGETDEGADLRITAVFCLEGEPECSGVLSLYVNGPAGAGTITSSPAGIDCSAGEECSGEFGGPVTFTAKPEPGYVIAGWLGCKQSGGDPTTCTTNVKADEEVTAIFLKEGTEGGPGQPGQNGASGQNGAPGAAGSQGPTGSNGAAGPQGSVGPQGPAGPAGKVKVTCKMQGKSKVKCVVKSAGAGGSSKRVNWRLMHGGHAVSHGTTSVARLQQIVNGLPSGDYVLKVEGQGGTRISIS